MSQPIDPQETDTLSRRLLLVVAVIAIVSAVGTWFILPYRVLQIERSIEQSKLDSLTLRKEMKDEATSLRKETKDEAASIRKDAKDNATVIRREAEANRDLLIRVDERLKQIQEALKRP